MLDARLPLNHHATARPIASNTQRNITNEQKPSVDWRSLPKIQSNGQSPTRMYENRAAINASAGLLFNRSSPYVSYRPLEVPEPVRPCAPLCYPDRCAFSTAARSPALP